MSLLPIFDRLGLSIERNPRTRRNVFKSKHTKRVLLSYITTPFEGGTDKITHTNWLECYTAAQIFDELGYRVDVAHCMSKGNGIDYDKYEVVYGFGRLQEQSFYAKHPERIKRIHYGTGCSPRYSDKVASLRVREVWGKKGFLLPRAIRIAPNSWVLQRTLSDCIIPLGNKYTENTYREENPNGVFCRLHCFYYDMYDIDVNKKVFEKGKKNLLWFGSSGALHKGLDRAIEAVKRCPDITLHVCGFNPQETDFHQRYQEELDNKHSQIVNHGFVKMDTDKFKEIMNLCGAVVFPSLSEGSAPAVLNVIANGGLIPIISSACGLDFEDERFVFDPITTENVIKMIKEYQHLTESEWRRLSSQYKDEVRKKYSYDNYKKNLTNIIQKAIETGK